MAEVSESCAQLIDVLPDEAMKKVVLLKFEGATDKEVAGALACPGKLCYQARICLGRKMDGQKNLSVAGALVFEFSRLIPSFCLPSF